MTQLWLAAVLGLVAVVGDENTAEDPGPDAVDAEDPPTDSATPAPPPLSPPVRLRSVVPSLPDDALPPGSDPVDVVLDLAIDEAGAVVDAAVRRSSGHPAVDAAALLAAAEFAFHPAQSPDGPVAVTIQYPLRFLAPPVPVDPATLPVTLRGRAEVRGTRTDAPLVTIELYAARPKDGFDPASPTPPQARQLDRGEAHRFYELDPTPAASTQTAADGTFALPPVPPGTWVAALGGGAFHVARFVEALPPGTDRTVTYRLLPTGRDETAVMHNPAFPDAERVLGAEDLRRIPGAYGDPVVALQTLPGVTSARDLTLLSDPTGEPAPVLRGAAAEDSVAILDDLPTPLLLHTLGFSSIVGQHLVDEASLVPAAPDASVGDVTGGVIGITTRSPRRDRVGGFVEPGLGQSAAAVEGPIRNNTRFYVGFRRSYFDLILGPILKEDPLVEFTTYPFFQDQQAVLELDPHEAIAVRVSYVGGLDSLRLIEEPDASSPTNVSVNVHSDLHRIAARVGLQAPGGIENATTVAVSFWRQEYALLEHVNTSDRHRTLHIHDRFSAAPLPWLSITSGLLLEVDDHTHDAATPPLGREDTGPAVTEFLGAAVNVGSEQNNRVWLGGWLGASFQPTPAVRVTPEFRLDWWRYLGDPVPQVRARLDLRPSPTVAFSLAGGRYEQAPSFADLSAVTGNPNLGPEGSWQVNLAAQLAPLPQLGIDLSAFARSLDHQAVDTRDRDAVEIAAAPDDDPTHGLANVGRGRVWGGEVLARFGVHRAVGVHGWVGYTLSWAQRKDGEEAWRWFQWDRRHQLTAVVRVEFPGEFGVGARFALQSAAPLTPLEGSVFVSDRQTFVPLWGEAWSARGPAYHQLDLRIDKRIRHKHHVVDAFVDIINVYYARSQEFRLYSYDWKDSSALSLIPLVNFGIRAEF